MLDDKSKLCPDLRGIINSFKVNWERVPGGRNWLMKMIPQAMEEMFKNGEVSEEFFDSHNFSVGSNMNVI